MKTKFYLSVMLGCAIAYVSFAQSTFQNLDFESSGVPSLPPGQYGGSVSSLTAIPSWTVLYGTNQSAQVQHNNFFLGGVNVSILGPSFSDLPILQGSYSVLLQSGLGSLGTPVSASISQTATIPAGASSLRFYSRFVSGNSSFLGVSIGGQVASLYAIQSTANHTVYGADVSTFSGQTTEVKISANAAIGVQYNYFLVDAFQFSNQPVPEPSATALVALGLLLFGRHPSGKKSVKSQVQTIMVFLLLALLITDSSNANAQGTVAFQNLDFENGTIAPVPNDPFGSVYWSQAMPGWTGHVGTNQVDRLLNNNTFFGTAGIALQGPNYPSANLFNGQFYIALISGLDPQTQQGNVIPTISQTGTITAGLQSVRYIESNPFSPSFILQFGGNIISLFKLGTTSNGRTVWGGDISGYVGQTDVFKIQGTGNFDNIQFSNQPIPEPSALGLLGLGVLLFCRRVSR